MTIELQPRILIERKYRGNDSIPLKGTAANNFLFDKAAFPQSRQDERPFVVLWLDRSREGGFCEGKGRISEQG